MNRKLKTMLVMAVGAAISILLWLLVAVPELEKMPADYHLARGKKLLIRLYEVWIPLLLAIVAAALLAAVGVAKVKQFPRGKENRG